MVEAEIISRRLLALNEALQHLRTYGGASDATQLRADPLLRAATERWLQTAVEACIDLAYQVIAERGWPSPDTARSAFAALAMHGVISAELSRQLGQAAGMRNILVHEYTEVDLELVAAVVREGLEDLEQFGALIGELLDEASA